ncbi:hypothetical protein G6F62_001617 [Rhizopus arrhizus]|uniref:rhizopuspepsin n=1 Tax=Rhizopus oryzae TaxID=64495 RepID=A0A9P7BRK0_RHIOR|nr:hypothetical protein G6F23_003230 [Rhizopus arrhizus]KAG0761646.1 hypothetical protein G6F24_007406 [Rhizopus arrhizus]KAG0947795.1 hypothetical protein G6F32_006048 [Rhizopus arrhizus]KAG1292377.1 hypothetical protein G6F66_007017 [Rhizopus arrhizus]KAG1306700.1 hypothetical protein G6F64_007392 [Rhizopus arrhizus]
MTISLKNTVLWNPSSDVSMYAFHEKSLQLLERLSYLYEIYLIIHVNSEEERNHIQTLLENSQGNIFAKSGGCIDYRKIIYCSEEEGKMHIIRHIESSVHIEGGWEQDDGEEIVKKLKPFMNKIIWIITKARKDSLKHEETRGGLGHNIELVEKLLDTSVAREVMQALAAIKLSIVQEDISLIQQSKKKRDIIPVIPLYNANAREYLINLSVGTPIQSFNVTLDTGSSDIWLPSSECPKSICSHSRFTESKSSTLSKTNQTFHVQYGSGSAKGAVAYDTVTIGNLSCPNQVLGLASFTTGISNGILGLGFSGLMTTAQGDLFITNLIKHNIIREPVFSIYLNRQDENGYTGEIVMGGYETSRFTGQLSFLPVIQYDSSGKANIGQSYEPIDKTPNSFRYWTVPGQAVSVMQSDGTAVYETQLNELQPAILDTGTTLSYLPGHIVTEILESITSYYKPLKLNDDSIQAYQVNCSDFLDQRTLWLYFQFSTAPNHFTAKPAVIRVPLREMILPQGTTNIKTAKTCLFGMAPISTESLSSTGWILGQTVLRSAYVVHDMLDLQVGIGAAANGYDFPTVDQVTNNSNIIAKLSDTTYSIIIMIFQIFPPTSNEKRILRVPLERRSRPDPIISAQMEKFGKRDNYMTSLYNDLGSQYLINIGIGTPVQNFTVTLDTGSADLWVPGKSCPTADCPNALFDPSASSTYASLDKAFTLTYGIGSVNGTYVTDSVTIAGATVTKQQFGLASDTKQILTNPNTITVSTAAKLTKRGDTETANGILGLGYPRLTGSYSRGQGAYNPFVFNLAAQDIISDPVFSIYLNNGDTDGWVGEIIFGGIDQTKFKGNLTYLPVVSYSSVSSKNKRTTLSNDGNYYWMVGAQGIAVTTTTSNTTTNSTVDSNAAVSISFNTTSAFILDTGTTLTYLPKSMADKVINAIAGSGSYSVDSTSGTYLVDCSVANANTQLELIMSDENKKPISLSVPASQLVIALDGQTAATSKSCLFGIAPLDSNSGNMYLVGDSVLRSAYMAFDMGSNKVGIAAAAGLNGNVQSSSFSFSTGDSSSASLTKYQSMTMITFISCLVVFFLNY